MALLSNSFCLPKLTIRSKAFHNSHFVGSSVGSISNNCNVFQVSPFHRFSSPIEKRIFSSPPRLQEFELERLFSNLNQATFQRDPGSLSSAIVLVAGTTVGAGILAIPSVTQEPGFIPSAAACVLCWFYMVVTGLLIAEINVKTMCELGSGGVSLVSMAKRTLGTFGVQIACSSYIFIHYALLVAYIARSSDIITSHLQIPLWASGSLFSIVLGGICYFGNQRFIGAVNGALVLGIIVSFTALVVVASGNLDITALWRSNIEALPSCIPVIALSFVYQNVIPVLCTNLEGDLNKVRTAIVAGTAIPLGLFITWNAVILGSVTGDRSFDPLQQLQSSSDAVGPIIEVFSLLALATSFVGFVLGLVDFLADLLKLPARESRPLPFVLTLVPPLVLSAVDPEVFFNALDFAGAYGVMILFGVLPAAMSWQDRSFGYESDVKLPRMIPGGQVTLFFVMAAAGYVVLSQLLQTFSHI